MSSQIQVDTQQIDAGVADLERRVTALMAEISSMNRAVETLLGSWHGAAAAGFAQAAQAWQGTQRQVTDNLGIMRQSLARAGSQYAEVEAANAAMFRG